MKHSIKAGKYVVSAHGSQADVDFNATYLITGRQSEKGFVTGGAFALGVSSDLNKQFNLQGELYGESKDASEPQGFFAASILMCQLNPKTSFDVKLKITCISLGAFLVRRLM